MPRTSRSRSPNATTANTGTEHRDRRDRNRDQGRARDRDDRDREREHRDRDRDRDRDRRRRSRSREKRSRRSSRSRSREKHSVTPLHLWERKMSFWDMPPPGYEGMSVAQVKATAPALVLVLAPALMIGADLFLPGQVAKPHNLLSMTALYGAPDVMQAVMAPDPAVPLPPPQPTNIARQARRLYVGGIPVGASEDALMSFFNQSVSSITMSENGNLPVIAVQINHEKNYAFVEFRTPEDATAAMALDGMNFGGQVLKIRRPKDYQPPSVGIAAPTSVPGVVSTQVPDSPFKLFIGGLPSYLNEDQVMELLKSFGELKAFNLVRDSATGASKGFAFCEYRNPVITDIACQGLNGMELDSKKLIVQRASIGANKPVAPAMTFAPSLLATTFLESGGGGTDPTNVVMLLNMVTGEELGDDEEYNDIVEDVREECSKYGEVLSVVIPRPGRSEEDTNVGKVFVEYESVHGAEQAVKALAGRRFAERTVFTSYVDAATFTQVSSA
ncbi:hypothetical protein HK405_008320 [Cladochytrium tenue]|nr:hypothetical protein HK405_008320 [Cladochytrium tenue]